MLALDAKLNLDDNAMFRHHELAALEDPDEMDPLEHEARKHHLNYIRLTGNVGAMVNGAGLAMATMDLIKAAGAEPANFLDVGGGASAEMVANGFRIILGDPNVKGVLINIFGGILRATSWPTAWWRRCSRLRSRCPSSCAWRAPTWSRAGRS